MALTHAGPAVALVLPLPWHTLLGSEESPRPHPKAETACGAGLGAAFYQGTSGSTEVNQVQVHFSNMCKLLSVTAKSKLSGEETPVFLYCFSPLSPHTCPSTPSSQPASYFSRESLGKQSIVFFLLKSSPLYILKDKVYGCNLQNSTYVHKCSKHAAW